MTQGTSPLADLARPIRAIGNGIRALAVVILAVVLGLSASGRMPWEPTGLVAPTIVFAIGELFRYAARRIENPRGLDLAAVAGGAFMVVGGLMLAGGLVMVFDDPAGFALMAFGLPFIGAGYLARRLLATPAGKKAVTVAGAEAAIRMRDGSRGTRSQRSVIYVDADAGDAEVAAAKHAWLRERWLRRPDWVAGRIVEAGICRQKYLKWAAGLWTALALGGIGAGLYWGGDVWLFAAVACLIAVGLATVAVIHLMRQRKFGVSELTLKSSPALLGGCLDGEVQTGLRQGEPPRDGFRLRLRCVHHWEESRYQSDSKAPRTYQHRDVVWEGEQRHPGHAGTGGPDRLGVPVEFDLPADLPATTLGGNNEGIRWELVVSAAVPGLDYVATFEVPVFDRDNNPA